MAKKINTETETDQDILQALDESNEEWVNAWREAVAKNEQRRDQAAQSPSPGTTPKHLKTIL